MSVIEIRLGEVDPSASELDNATWVVGGQGMCAAERNYVALAGPSSLACTSMTTVSLKVLADNASQVLNSVCLLVEMVPRHVAVEPKASVSCGRNRKAYLR